MFSSVISWFRCYKTATLDPACPDQVPDSPASAAPTSPTVATTTHDDESGKKVDDKWYVRCREAAKKGCEPARTQGRGCPCGFKRKSSSKCKQVDSNEKAPVDQLEIVETTDKPQALAAHGEDPFVDKAAGAKEEHVVPGGGAELTRAETLHETNNNVACDAATTDAVIPDGPRGGWKSALAEKCKGIVGGTQAKSEAVAGAK